MKYSFVLYLVLAINLLSLPVFSQTGTEEEEQELLGLPGDNLDLFAVLNLFQKSKTIEDFQKSLNLEETGINNLDLNLDEKIDFIKVTTKQDGDDFIFVLQVDVSEKEVQDLAVILVSKEKEGEITMQIVGDKDLYGKDYVIEPAPPAPKVTANPAYKGPDPVVVIVESTPTVVVVQSAPIVQYVYSPAYVPYYPPYYYAYHPPYYAAVAVVAVGIYRHNNYYHHHGYHGGGNNNNVHIHKENNFNNYNKNRNSSNTVNRNNTNGNYNRSSGGASSRPSTTTGNRGSSGASTSARPSATTANRGSSGASKSARPSTSQARSSTSTRPSSSYNNSATSRSRSSYPSSSSSRYNSSSRPSSSSRSYGGSRGGGGRRR
jgi:hypothetical protein